MEGFVILRLSESALCWSERDVALFRHLKTVGKLSLVLCVFLIPWHLAGTEEKEDKGKRRERGGQERDRQRQRETEADTERLSLLAEGTPHFPFTLC